MERTRDLERATVVQNGKRVVKRGLQLIGSALGQPMWCFPDRSLVVLMYHRILPDDHPDWRIMQPGMVVSARSFELHLDLLKEHFTLVHLSEWLQRAQTGRSLPTRACAITFDDGWSDTYETAFPILRRHHVPATVFLVSDYIDTECRFWPERLVKVLRRARALPGVWSTNEFSWLRALGLRHTLPWDDVISSVKVLPDREIQGCLEPMEAALGETADPGPVHLMKWAEAREMVWSGLVEVGSHTRTHCRCKPSMSHDEATHEIVGSKRILEERLGRKVDLFCYPNGDIAPKSDQIVRQHYMAACSTQQGWNVSGSDRHQLRRIGLHEGVSGDQYAFLARLSGWV